MDFFIALFVIAAISLFFVVRFRLNAAVAPFFTVAAITLWMCLLGMLNLLDVAVWTVIAFAILSLIYLFIIKKERLSDVIKVFFTPGMVFFLFSSILFFVLLSIRHPYFVEWDEFSFWGVSAKLIFGRHQLYTFIPSSFVFSYPPVLPVWSFFVQFFGQRFVEWKVFLAYDVLIMSVMSLLFARVKWKHYVTCIVLTVFGLTSLYLFWWSFDNILLYCTSYSDWIIGVVFGGVLLAHFSSEDNNLMRWVVTLVGVMLLPLMKDIGMALGLVVAGIVLIDIVLSGNYPTETLFRRKSKWLRALLPLALFAAVLLTYSLWNAHFQAQVDLSRAPRVYEYSMLEIMTGKDLYFNEILKRMWNALSVNQIVSFGPMRDMILVFTLIPVIAGILTFDKKRFFRLASFSVLMLGGFALYYLFHAYSYAAIFAHTTDYELQSYARYMSTYCVGWLVAVAGVCFFEIAQPKLLAHLCSKDGAHAKRYQKVISDLVVATTIAALLVASVFIYNPAHPDQYVFTSSKIDRNKFEMEGVRASFYTVHKSFRGYLTPEDRVYFIAQGSNGGEWFRFNYEFIEDAHTVQTLGRGNFVDPSIPEKEREYYDEPVDPDTFIAFLRENQIDLLYVYLMDDYFYTEFGPLFSDQLAGAMDKTIFFYLVVDNGGSDIQFVPVPSGKALENVRTRYGMV